ncbi:hypothetical protein K458DRAFT_44210 [Lentithecium fluviatile CBS 122367]|uniref:Uncharacterized protein n=1 Tax=Lentithecium fluviatile CBS 122367 TaxID=1168545 RepID=A0A6G1IYC6_9PLEO|nr:hypothetical protein K458DRAFT_44210 [Lentithecium fluviatile CBS 122367]
MDTHLPSRFPARSDEVLIDFPSDGIESYDSDEVLFPSSFRFQISNRSNITNDSSKDVLDLAEISSPESRGVNEKVNAVKLQALQDELAHSEAKCANLTKYITILKKEVAGREAYGLVEMVLVFVFLAAYFLEKPCDVGTGAQSVPTATVTATATLRRPSRYIARSQSQR